MRLFDVLLAVHWLHNQPAGWHRRYHGAEPWQGPGPGSAVSKWGFTGVQSAVSLRILIQGCCIAM